MSTTDLIVLRNTLVTRLAAARVIAKTKQRPDLAARCTMKIDWVRCHSDASLHNAVDGVDDLIGDIHRAGTMADVRDAYQAHLHARVACARPQLRSAL